MAATVENAGFWRGQAPPQFTNCCFGGYLSPTSIFLLQIVVCNVRDHSFDNQCVSFFRTVSNGLERKGLA